MVIRRGDIWFADLGEPMGSNPGYERPVLIVQDDHFNDSGIATVVVIGMTSNTSLAMHPGNLFLKSSDSGLPKDSVVNISQIVAIDKDQLVRHVGSLSSLDMDQVDYGLGLVLGLK